MNTKSNTKAFLYRIFAAFMIVMLALAAMPVTPVYALARTATVSGNWNSTATWGGSSVPGAGDTVTINSGVIVTVTAPAAATSITFNAPSANSGITISGTNSLTVSGGITTNLPTANNVNTTIAVDAGSLSAGSIALAGATVASRTTNLTISTGTVTVSGNITSAGVASAITFTGAGTLNAGGTFMSGTKGTFTPGTGTVNFNAAGAQSVAPFTYTFNNLTLSGSGAKSLTNATINGNLTLSGTATATTSATTIIGGNLNVGDGTTFTAAGFALTVTGTTTVGGGTSGNLTISSATGLKTFTGLVTVNAGATWNNSGNSAVTFNGGITNNGTFTAGTGVYTFATNAQALTGTLLIPSITVTGVTLTNNNTLTVGTALSGTGGLTQAAGSTLNIGGSSGITTLTATSTGNTVNYNGSGAQTAQAINYYNLTISGTGARTLSGAIGVAGTFTPGTNSYTITGSTVDFNGAGAQNIPAFTFNNFSTSNGGTKTLGGAVIANGNVTIGLGTVLATGVNALTVGGNWTNNAGISGLTSTGTVTFNGASGQTINGANTWYDLAVTAPTAARTISFQGGVTQSVTHSLTLTGTASNLLTLTTTASPTKWGLHAPAIQSVSYVSPSYSDASGGTAVDATSPTNVDGLNNINWNLPLPAPIVTTTGATDVTASSATLNGTVNASGSDTSVTFQYGTSISYGSTVTSIPGTVTGASNTNVSAAITGLSSGTLYHYRVVGTSVNGTRNGADSTFIYTVGSTYYVDNTNVSCSDAGTGLSPSTPFCTIGKGASVAVSQGSTVRVLAGTYAETVTPAASGVAGSPITFSAAPGVTVTGAATSNGFRVSSKSYVVIDGFNVTGADDIGIYVTASNHITISNSNVSLSASPVVSGTYRSGINLNNTTYSIVTGNTSHHNSSHGIYLSNGSSYNTVSNNISYANAQEFIRNANGIDLITNSNYNTIIHNIVYANEDTGLNFYSGSSNNQVIGNLTYDNGDHGIDNNAAPNNVYIGNTVQGNVTVGMNFEGASAPGSGGATVMNNIMVDNGLLLQVGGGSASGSNGNIRIDTQSFGGMTLDYNMYHLNSGTIQIDWNGVTYTSLAAFKAAEPGQELHGLQANPLLVAPAPVAQRPSAAPWNVAVNIGNYYLNSGSPAIDSANSNAPGESLTDIDGNARVDDPGTVDTGAGVRTYDDRGAYEFLPLPALPTVTTQAVTSIAATTATGNGNITAPGVPNPTQHGVVWSTSLNPTIADSKTTDGPVSAAGAFTSNITGLTPGTLYHVRAYATNTQGTSYGDDVTFTTLIVPTVTTQAVTNISQTTATGNGNIISLGIPNPTEHGVVWSITANPTIADNKTTDGAVSAIGAFTSNITGLTPNTLYHVRAYATNGAGTSYGGDVTFTTLVAPTVTTQAVTSIGTTTATGNGNVTALGVPNPTEHGVVWSTVANPTIANSKTTDGPVSVTGAFTSAITGLTPNTLYHVRAYATNTAGTSYGDDVSFTTVQAPTVTTQAATDITTTIATGNGNITVLGTSNPTEHGFVWSTSIDPTTADSKTMDGPVSATGAFTSAITGLTPGTLYHVRAYATNSAGTSYGGDVTFTTLIAPTVTTQAVTNIAQTTATGNGNVTALGVPNPTQHGVVWSTNANPTIADNKTTEGAVSATGAFTSNITGLALGMQYHVRAYATNAVGTVYGDDVIFTTLPSSTGTTTPVTNAGTGTNVIGTGTVDWLNPGNITAADSVNATVTLNNATSHYLEGTNYGFAIPSNATINGIVITVGRFESGVSTGTDVRDSVVSLIKGGTIIGDNKAALTTEWPITSPVAAVYGTTSDLWGTTWTPADINASNFGVALSANSVVNRIAYVDYMQISVTYTVTIVSSTTTVNCGAGTPSVIYGSSITCVATVVRGSGPNTPTGNVSWTTNGAGSIVTSPCALSGSAGTAICSVVYTPSSVGTGSHLITAAYPGDASFFSSNGNQVVTVNKMAASVTPNAASKTYGDVDPVLTGALVGFLPADSVTATYSRAAGETFAGGPYMISATLSPVGVLANYNITYNTDIFNINKKPASVTLNAASKTYGDIDPTLSGSIAGFLPADSVTATYSRVAGETVANSPYAISATLSPAGVLSNYNITTTPANFTINKKDASVTLNAASKTYGDVDPALTGALAGFLPADSVSATYSRIAGETVAGGPYTISETLSPAGVLPNYNITTTPANFTINKKDASVTPNAASKLVGSVDPPLTGSITGFLPADGVSATYSRVAGETVEASPYTISATLSPTGVLPNYNITYNTANFTITPPLDEYTLTLLKYGNGTITATPNQATYHYGDVVTLTATPDIGWSFFNWSPNVIGGTVTIHDNTTVSAVFIQDEYTLTSNKIGNGTVTKVPDQATYHYGDVVALTATPDAGWSFGSWSANVIAGNVTIHSNTTVTATFTQDEYTLTIDKIGSGSVAKAPDQATYHYGDVVTLTATPTAGWSFDSWTSNATGGTVTIHSNTTVIATFTQDAYTLTVDKVGNGTVTKVPDQATYYYGDVVALTATPDAGWSFGGWSANVIAGSVTIHSNTTVTATFTQDEYSLTITKIGNGTVTKVPDQVTYHYGDVVALTATPDAGWSFGGWSANVVAGNVTINANTTVTATFTQDEYSLTVNKIGNGAVTKTPDQATYHYGDVVALTATPDAGWSFGSWSANVIDGSVTIHANTTVSALFTQDEYSLTINKVGNGAVTKTPDQATYHYGDVVALTATPDVGWSFGSWSANVVAGSVTINANTTVTATFTQDAYTLTVNKVGNGTVLKAPDQPTYHYGDVVALTATPDAGWSFGSWSANVVAGNVTINANTTVTATFTQDEYTLTITKVGNGTVAIVPDQLSYHYGDIVQLSTTPDLSWAFTGWSGDMSGAVSPQELTMNGNKNVTATFNALSLSTVTTQAVTAITTTTATGNGNVTDLGAPNPTQHGVVWSTSLDPTIADSKAMDGPVSVTGAFTSNITGLTPGTLYHVRAYATNTQGTSYGADVTFTTLIAPTVTTDAVTNITTTTATGNGNITVLGVPNPTEHGVVWSITTNPTITDNKTTDGAVSATGAFTSSITGLTPGTLYHVRAYATNAAGTSYGTDVSFTALLVPTVTTQAVTNITATTATGNGNVTVLGVPNPTQHGVVWSTSLNPTIADSKTTDGAVSVTGAFTSAITGLTPNTLYHVRAYATNAAGTSYGTDVTFTTLLTPTVTTQAVTNITTTTATGNGNITNLGIPNPTQYGVVWDTAINPTIALTTKTAQGVPAGTGPFTSNITGLTSGTLYHVRAYATNTVGTSYGDDVTFTALIAPTVTTQAVTSITATTATGNGNVTVLGVPNPTEHGVVWATTVNPTTANSKTTDGPVSATGAFTSVISGLIPGTLYHVRAYATNTVATVYGTDVSFTTLASTQETFTASGSWTAPAGVTSVTVEVWGGGGKGGTRSTTNNTGGGGGGGGAYSTSTIVVTPGNSYSYVVGAGATTTAAGGDSYFNNTSTVLAKGGNSVADNTTTSASGGAAASGVGTTKYSGGNGANAGSGYGGGGGSSAGTAANGTNATNVTGATAPAGGGNGGNGKSSPAGNGTAGLAPGGAGGGAYRQNSGTYTGGNGVAGQVRLTYYVDVKATATSVNCGAGTPVVTYGSSITCVATVTASSGTTSPSGSVSWTTNGAGSIVTSPCTLSGTGGSAACSVTYTPSSVGTGSHLITASYAGNTNFLASSGNQTVTINKKAASVTPNAASKTYGNVDPALTGALAGFLPADSVTATYSRIAGETVAGGPYTISATLSPVGVLANYNITYNTDNFTINKKAASVTPTAASKTYGDADPASFTGTLSGFLPADSVTATYSRIAGETVAGGPYTISATLNPVGVLANYNITYNTDNFTINKKAASVTPTAASKTYGDADPASFTGTLSGFLPADSVTATYSRVAGETAGPYTISAVLSPAGVLDNYTISNNTAVFTINKKDASVTPNAASKLVGDVDPVLTGSLAGFLPADGVTAIYSRVAGETVEGSPYLIGATLSPVGVLPNYNITYNTANFTITQIEYMLTVNIVGSGSVTRGLPGPYHLGDIVDLTPVPSVGWSFSAWTGACTGSGACSVTMDAAKTVTATFTQDEYALTIVSVNGTVTKNPNLSTYHEGDVVLLTATADTNWSFANWTGALISSFNPDSVTIHGNTTVTANYTAVNIAPTFTSTPVTSVTEGAVYTYNITATDPNVGDTLTITAPTKPAWLTFTDNGSGSATLTGTPGHSDVGINNVTLRVSDGIVNVDQAFTIDVGNIVTTYALTVNKVGNGTVTPDKAAPYYLNDVVNLTAVADAGWTFSAWTGACTGSGACSVTMDTDKTVTATFTQNEYALTVNKVGNGTITPDKAAPYHLNDVVNLTAVADAGWTFSAWTGACTGSGICSVTMDADKTVTATFTQSEFTLTINKVGNGTVTPDIAAPYHLNDVVNLTAVADAGWSFSGWTGACTGSGACSITMDADKTITATFTQTGGLTAGTYDDADTAWTYTGSWTAWTTTGPYLDTLHYSYSVGDSAEVTFTGQQLKLTYAAGAGGGIVDVYVDGVKLASIDQSSDLWEWQKTWTSEMLSAGTHSLRFVLASSGFVTIDSIEVMATPVVLSIGTYDDTNPAFGYSGNWRNLTTTGPYLDTLKYSYRVGDSVQTYFTGQQIKLTYAAGSGGGIVDVYVDGVKLASIDQSSATWDWQATWMSERLPTGTHSLRIVFVSGVFASIDAIQVMTAPVTLTTGTYDDTNPAFSYSGSWRTWTITGSYLDTLSYSYRVGDSVQTYFTGQQIKLTYLAGPTAGIVDVYVDGVKVASINQRSETWDWQATWMSERLSAGDHNLRLVYVSGGYASLDAMQVMAAPDILPTGIYDDANATFSYSGSWLTMSGVTGPYLDTLRYTYRVGDSVQTYFTGQQIKLTYLAGPSAGIMDVYVDGAKVASVNQYSDNWEWQKTWTSDLFTAGTHNLRIVYAIGASGGFASLDAIQVMPAPVILATGTYDDVDTAFIYTGTWLTMSGVAGPYLGTLHYSYSVGDSVQAYFTGQQINLSYFAGPSAGIADIYVDGVKVASVNQYSDNWEWQKIWTSDLFAAGTHSLRIVYASGTSGSGFISVDAVTVIP